MSFGYSVGDFALLTQLAWRVVQNSRKACGAHDELTSEVTSLHIVLRRLELEIAKPNSILSRRDDSLNRKDDLAQLSGDCRRVLKILDEILGKYNALSQEKRSVTKLWKKIRFGNGEMLDLSDIRLKISTYASLLTMYINLLGMGSLGKVESFMESQGEEVREMRRSLNYITARMQAEAPKDGEGTILTSYAGDDTAIWKDFRRELIKEGFSSTLLQKHMKTIKEYVTELGNRGALDDIGEDVEDQIDGNSEVDAEEAPKEDSESGTEDELEESEGQSASTSESESEDEDVVSEAAPVENAGDVRDERTDQDSLESEPEDEQSVNLSGAGQVDNPGDVEVPKNQGIISSGNERVCPEPQANADSNLGNEDLGLDSRGDKLVEADGDVVSNTTGTDFGSPSEDALVNPAQKGISSHTDPCIANSDTQIPRILSVQSPAQPEISINAPELTQQPQRGEFPERDQNQTPEIASQDHLNHLVPKWFGTFCKPPSVPALWTGLRFHTDNILIDYYGNKDNNRVFEVRQCSLVLLCNWMVDAAIMHDQARLSLSVSSRELYAPLVDELRQLLFRACAYHTRVRHIWGVKFDSPVLDQWLNHFSNYSRDFGLVIAAFRQLVVDGLNYVAALKIKELEATGELEPANQPISEASARSEPTEWWASYCENQRLKQNLDQVKRERKLRWEAFKAEIAELLYDMEFQDCVDFIRGLFEADDAAVSLSDFIRQTQLTKLVPKLQALLIFYKQNCEEYIILLDEKVCVSQGHHEYHLDHVIKASELLDPSISEAAKEMEIANLALDSWSVKYLYNDKLPDLKRAEPLFRDIPSLNAILERCDDAQAKLRKAREDYWAQRVPRGPAPVSKRAKEKRKSKGKGHCN